MKRKINWRKVVGRFFLILFLLSFILPLLSRIMPSGMNKAETKLFFESKGLIFKDTFLQYGKQSLRFVCAGNDTLPMILFIHGSPGSWDAFKEYLSDTGLLANHYLVAINRPGYGGTSMLGEATLQAQANAVAGVFHLKRNAKPMVIVSHSYGGPVAVKFTLQYPEAVSQLILIAPTICPEIEEGIGFKRGLQKFSKLGLWRWTLAEDLKNSTREMQPLPEELRIMQPEFIKLKCPVTEIHGTDDALAPFGNQAYVKLQFVNAPVDTIVLRGEGHLIPFTMPAKIIEMIKAKVR